MFSFSFLILAQIIEKLWESFSNCESFSLCWEEKLTKKRLQLFHREKKKNCRKKDGNKKWKSFLNAPHFSGEPK